MKVDKKLYGVAFKPGSDDGRVIEVLADRQEGRQREPLLKETERCRSKARSIRSTISIQCGKQIKVWLAGLGGIEPPVEDSGSPRERFQGPSGA
jgi:hypothetical protein